MLASIRKFLNTRAARLFFVVLIVPFVLFGVANVAQNWHGNAALATVGNQTVEPAAFQSAFRQQLGAVIRQMGGKTDPTPSLRRMVAGQTLQQLITQAAIEGEVHRLGLAVPDTELRQAVFAMPAFNGLNGAFDRSRFEALLRQNNLTEPRFLDLMRSDLGQRQLIEAVGAGAATPDVLVKQLFALQHEQRAAELVELPFLAAPEPPPPGADSLRQAYENDPQRYSAPAYRRIKAVILSPDTVAKSIEVPDADIQAYYDQHKAEFGAPEKRSVQVVVAQDEAAAQRLAAQWSGGADWSAMQKAANEAGASAAQLDDAAQADLPGTELAEAAFRAPPNTVTGPIKSAFGWQIFNVSKVTAATEQTLTTVHDQVRDRLARERAVDQVYTRANKLEDALSAGTALDDLPGDLGVAAITGSLDAQGNTAEGDPAPIPGSPALRQAVIATAFSVPLNDPPRMIEGPDQSYYALVAESQTAAQVKPFEAVQDQVRDNYLHDMRRRTQEVVAARLLTAIKAGGSLDDAATVAGVPVERTPLIHRGAPNEGVAAEIIQPLFGMKLNDGTMLETSDGFVVLKLVTVQSPDPASDPAGAAQLRTALDRSIGQDTETLYANALRERAKPTVNQAMLDSLSQ